MKSWILYLIVVLSACECSSQEKEGPVTNLVKRDTAGERAYTAVNIQGATNWFSLEQLRLLSDKHLQATNPAVQFTNFFVTANIHSQKTNVLVRFEYYQNFGVPVYFVEFDKLGRVTSVTSRIATETQSVRTAALDRERAIAIAKKELFKVSGIREVEVTRAVCENEHWIVTIWALPKAPGGWAAVEVFPDGSAHIKEGRAR